MADERFDPPRHEGPHEGPGPGPPLSPRESLIQLSNVSLCLSYDLIDKLRFWEKETLKLSDEEIAARLEHLSIFLEQLRTAYLTFSESDF
jgi:hypothetical protein